MFHNITGSIPFRSSKPAFHSENKMNKQQQGLSRLHINIALLITSLVISTILLVSIQTQSVNAHSLFDTSILNNNINDDQRNNSNDLNANVNGNSGNGHGRHYHPNGNGNGNGHSRGGSNGHQASLYGSAPVNRCANGWIWLKNKCWVATQSRRSFSHAIELCRKSFNNSTLPTIHSQEENDFLRQNIDLKNSPMWIYARHNHQYNSTRWLDKSQIDYTNWDNGQPNDKSSMVCVRTEDGWYMKKTEPIAGQADCITFWEDGKWATQVGCTVLLPVVCEKKLLPMDKYSIDSSIDQNGTAGQMEQQMHSHAMPAIEIPTSLTVQVTILTCLFQTIVSQLLVSHFHPN